MTLRRATACFTFDNMGEAALVGEGRLAGPRPQGEDEALTVGHPAILDLLDRTRVPATFFIEGWNGEHHPDAVAEIVRRGHELGMHGWLHEPWSVLDPDTERDLAARATEALERASGTRVRGFRAPGGSRSRSTEDILHGLGYRYDASLGEGMQAQVLPSGLAQIPFVWSGVDGFYYLRPEGAVSPDVVREAWLAALATVTERGGLFMLICHPFLTGLDPARVEALEAVMHEAMADPRVDVTTVGAYAECLLEEEVR